MEETNNQGERTCNADTGAHQVTEQEMLLELKILMSEYYIATYKKTEKYLQTEFTNGQKFKVFIEECK